jgi:YidC/Oxa1 family membrane protein insertase
MSELWQGLLGFLADVLLQLHDVTAPLFGAYAWGWAIILLTIMVRTLMLPLAIQQTRSARAMQGLQPEIKKIQQRYKTDRSLMRSDPEKFREMRTKQQEELQRLYKDKGVNPAASCLPLLLQMPVAIALFNVLRDEAAFRESIWYLIDPLSETATTGAGIGAWLLLALMGLTTFVSQKQLMSSNPTMADQPQQRVLLYAMPAMLTVFGINIPAGVLIYWVTTNLWTTVQQRIMFRPVAPEVTAETAKPAERQREGEQQPGPKKASAPKGVPTPKRDDVRRERAAGNGKASTSKARSGKGKGSTAASKRRP